MVVRQFKKRYKNNNIKKKIKNYDFMDRWKSKNGKLD